MDQLLYFYDIGFDPVVKVAQNEYNTRKEGPCINYYNN